MTIRCEIDGPIAEVVMHHPPVNAITVGDTWKIHDTFKELGENREIRAIILSAEGKGFNAGIDIKEMQSVEGWEHLLGSVFFLYSFPAKHVVLCYPRHSVHK